MSFQTELEAFIAYAEAMPNNCVFLVDTYDTLSRSRRNAIALYLCSAIERNRILTDDRRLSDMGRITEC